MAGASSGGLTPANEATPLPRFGVVVLTMGRRPDDLRRGLQSVRAQHGVETDVVVVGNGWQPEGLPTGVRAHPLSENVGIPAGRNAGVPEVAGDLLFFLDDDASLGDSDTLARLAALLKRQNDDGGFAATRAGQPSDLAATAYALPVLKDSHGKMAAFAVAQNQARSIDKLVRNAAIGGTWVSYVSGVGARTGLDTTNDLLTFADAMLAQGILRARAHRFSNDELIEKLRRLFQQHGYLSGLIIDEAEGMPSSAAYAHRFGSLIRAYQAVGFTPDRDYKYLEVNQFLRRLHPEIVGRTERMIAEVGGAVVRDPASDLLTVNREFTVSLVLSRCQLLDNDRRRWKVRFDTSLTPDITVAVRLDDTNQSPLDYYLLPRLDFGRPRVQGGIHLADHNGLELESYRFDTLDGLYGMAERSRIRRAA